MDDSPPDDFDHTRLLQLWMLRALQPDRIRKNFVHKQGFRDDDDALQIVSSLTNATPGDFANCRRQARFKNFESPENFATALAEECRTKAAVD